MPGSVAPACTGQHWQQAARCRVKEHALFVRKYFKIISQMRTMHSRLSTPNCQLQLLIQEAGILVLACKAALKYHRVTATVPIRHCLRLKEPRMKGHLPSPAHPTAQATLPAAASGAFGIACAL
eukprot:1159977-Pelagomonas_calceolata.AAC.1